MIKIDFNKIEIKFKSKKKKRKAKKKVEEEVKSEVVESKKKKDKVEIDVRDEIYSKVHNFFTSDYRHKLNILFQISLVTYLLVLLVNEFYSVDNRITNVLLILVIGLGILSVIFEDKTPVINKRPGYFDYGFGIVLGIIGGVLIFIKTKDLGMISYIISIISAILIILVSFLILEEDDKEESKPKKSRTKKRATNNT